MGDPRATSAFHTDNMSRNSADALVAALDSQAASAGVRRLRDWAHLALAAREPGRPLVRGFGEAAVQPG